MNKKIEELKNLCFVLDHLENRKEKNISSPEQGEKVIKFGEKGEKEVSIKNRINADDTYLFNFHLGKDSEKIGANYEHIEIKFYKDGSLSDIEYTSDKGGNVIYLSSSYEYKIGYDADEAPYYLHYKIPTTRISKDLSKEFVIAYGKYILLKNNENHKTYIAIYKESGYKKIFEVKERIEGVPTTPYFSEKEINTIKEQGERIKLGFRTTLNEHSRVFASVYNAYLRSLENKQENTKPYFAFFPVEEEEIKPVEKMVDVAVKTIPELIVNLIIEKTKNAVDTIIEEQGVTPTKTEGKYKPKWKKDPKNVYKTKIKTGGEIE